MRIGADEALARIEELSSLLVDVVDGGSSVGFLRPLEPTVARAFWEEQLPRLAAGTSLLFGASADDGTLCGVVMLHLAGQQNGQHRAEIAKMMVRADARRCGHASRLLAEAEQAARARERSLLVLDTVPGTDAERLYLRHGWEGIGVIADFARTPDGELAPTRIFVKRLD